MSACGRRRPPVGGATPESAEILGNCGNARVEQLASRDHDEVEARTRGEVQMSEYLSNQPFSSVPVDRIAEFS